VKIKALRERILADTSFEPAGDLVPEIRLLLAKTPREILREASVDRVPRGEPPYWAFAWPGGQALARFVLDNADLVAGKSVLDVGAGSGIAAIAAMRAGAVFCMANDIDPLAALVAGLNAEGNGVRLEVSSSDLLDGVPLAEVFIIGDLVYEPSLEQRVAKFLKTAMARGIPVLFGDRATSKLPALPFVQVAQYETVVAPPLEDGWVETARVWRLDPG
jgi:predicted nicotinamide N-methyase